MRTDILSFICPIFRIFTLFLSILLLTSALLSADCFLLAGSLSASDTPSFSKIEDDSSWHISALKVSYDNERQIYVAEDQVIISSRNIELKADYVEFSNISRDAQASGNVLLVSGGDSITCDRLTFNLEAETGTIYNGVVFIEENHFYIKGDTIEKTGKDTYHSSRASVTSCDGENPDWKISGKDIKVTIDGYGTAKSATFWTGKIPALYSPIVLFPAKTKRQTGLLIPRISSSDKKGFEFEQPIFVALSRGTDATFYSDYMSKRGTKAGIEYRYVLSSNSFGTIFYDYLNDSGSDENEIQGDRYWFRMKNSHEFDNRWSAKVDIDYASDADYLRDFKEGLTGFDSVNRYFKNTFGRGFDEYDDTTRENSININKIWSSAALNIGAQWFDNIRTEEFSKNSEYNNNNLEYSNNNLIDEKEATLHKLPSVQFDTIRQRVGNSYFYYDIDSEYRYFYRENTYSYNALSSFYSQSMGKSLNPLFARYESLVTGHRTDIYPKVYLPLKLGAFYIEPSAGVRQSLWYVDDNGDDFVNNINSSIDENFVPTSESDNIDFQSFSHREMIDLNLEVSTKLSKVFNIGDGKNGLNNQPVNSVSKFSGKSEKIKHEIIPKIKYLFIPEVNQDDLPYFDELDYIGERNRVRWSFGNRFTYRNGNRSYNEFAWFEISQSYRIDESASDIDEEKSASFNSTLDRIDSNMLFNFNRFINSDEPYFKSGNSFSDICARVEFSPFPLFSLNNDFKWSPYDNSFSSNDSGVIIKDKRGDTLETWYRYQKYQPLLYHSQSIVTEYDESLFSETESLFASLNTKITDSLNLFFACEHSLTENKNVESHAGFYLNKSCWSMRLSYSDTPDDKSVALMVNLHGIGEFGKR